MSKTPNNVRPISTSCSDLSELICEAHIDPSQELEALNLIGAIKAEESRLDNVISQMHQQIASMEGSVSEERDELEEPNEIQGIEEIYYRTSNLLDEQLMETFSDLVKTHGSLKVLQALQELKM